jgi:hypothetical protein
VHSLIISPALFKNAIWENAKLTKLQRTFSTQGYIFTTNVAPRERPKRTYSPLQN